MSLLTGIAIGVGAGVGIAVGLGWLLWRQINNDYGT